MLLTLGLGFSSFGYTPVLPVTAGLQLYLAADAINPSDATQINNVNGTYYVKSWLDQSPNHANAVQATAAKQPVYVPNVVFGKGVLKFDGVNDVLVTSLPQVAGNKSVFVVHKRINILSPSGTELSSSTAGNGFFFGNDGGNESFGRLGIAHDAELLGLTNEYMLKAAIRNGSTTTFYVNDATATTTAADRANGYYSISDGNNFPYSGAIAEVLVYNRAVTELERQAIENYLSEKWGLWPMSLPVSAGLEVWLASEGINQNDASQVQIRNGAYYVSKWQGRGPIGRSATQATLAKQPQLNTNSANHRFSVVFDGVDDLLQTAESEITGDKTIISVMNRTGTTNGLEISSTANGTNMFLGNNGSTSEGKGRFSANRVGQVFDLQVPLVTNTWLMKSYKRAGTTETLQVNDAVATATVGYDFANGVYTLSDPFNQPFKGEIGELMIYKRALSASESTATLNYLQNKWSWTIDNVYRVAPDLTPPVMTTAAPAAGTRVQQTTPSYAGTSVYHTLYLPTDWQPGKKYPVIVEYAPNGPFNGDYGDVTTGRVDALSLGYGLTAGAGYIIIGMPTIGGSPLANQVLWWGDVATTKDYCLQTVRYICENYGGDPSAVFIAGFSRGAIACNYIGLNDDTMADVWVGFIPHAHYDGQIQWGYEEDDVASALTRLQRLKGRAQHVSHETAITGEEEYLAGTGVDLSMIHTRTLPFPNHTDQWALRPIQLRRDTRAWLQQTLANRPGTHAISGRVTSASGAALAGVRIQSGYTHFTFTAADGTYTMAGLIDSTRTVSASGGGTFADRSVTLSGSNVTGVNFQSSP